MRAAIIGTQHPHSRAYQETFALMPELEIVGIVADGGKPVHDAIATVPRYRDIDTLLDEQDPELAFVFLNNRDAVATMETLVEKGKHVFSDKPGARSATELAKVALKAEQAGLVLAIGYQNRFTAEVQQIRSLIQEGLLGRLYSLEARMITTSVAVRDPAHYLFSREVSGGGIVSWLGCHHIDLLQYVSGLSVTAVSAMTANVGGQAIDVEDLAAICLRFGQHVLGSLHQGYLLPRGEGDPFMQPSYENFIGIRGEKGWLRWNLSAPEIQAFSIDPRWRGASTRTFGFVRDSLPGYGGVAGQQTITYFLDKIRGEQNDCPTGKDGVGVLAVIDAIYQAAQEKCEVAVQTFL